MKAIPLERRAWPSIAAGAACLLASVLSSAPHAMAQSAACANFFGLKVGVDQVRAEWDRFGSDFEECIHRRTGLTIDQLSDRCIKPNDQRVNGYVRACAQEVQQSRFRQQQQERALAIQQEAEARARAAQDQAEAHRRAVQEQAEARAQQALLAEKAAEKARHDELVAKYGNDAADAILAHKVIDGMDMEEVAAARGEPRSRVVVPPSDEMWRYGVDNVVFLDGKVTYVGP